MNRLRMTEVLLLLFIIFSNILFAQSNNRDSCKAKVFIKTNDSTSVVYINGNAAGDGSNISAELPEGNYSLLIKKNKFKWDSKLIHDSLLIKNCDTTINLSYTFNPDKKIFVNSNPSNAEVYYQDSLIGYTPLNLADNLSIIDIKKNKFEDKEVELDKKIKEVNLNLDYLGKREEPSFFTTNLFKLLLGSAVALGATAAYFKLKADDNSDQYNATNDKKFLDNRNRYDLISGVAFGALQINFGILIYHFLTD